MFNTKISTGARNIGAIYNQTATDFLKISKTNATHHPSHRLYPAGPSARKYGIIVFSYTQGCRYRECLKHCGRVLVMNDGDAHRTMNFSTLFAMIMIIFFDGCTTMSESTPFWTTAELINVEWKKGCLTTAYCSSPQFRLTTSNYVSTESNSISWTVTEDIVQEQSRPFISYWIEGTPSDLSVACEVIGSDPKYGFQRTCDYTPAVGIFRDNVQPNTSYISGKIRLTTPKLEKARKATAKFVFDERFELACVAILATICVLSAAAFTWLLVAYLKQRSNVESRESEKTYLANLMKVDSPFGRTNRTDHDSSSDQRQKFAHWPSSTSSNETTSTRTASSNEASPKGVKPNNDAIVKAEDDGSS
ncbi:Uncharacterized protein C05B5.4 [Toxocara canis]|uniref:Uncharacterized protein C05B5.4 n=1 Tax=Toxocara canis TaxID=6265 RepID=A0A0B2VCE2_TOXCA|nr:Uncharacterized protein C05B5.4 [Toxocara canis]